MLDLIYMYKNRLCSVLVFHILSIFNLECLYYIKCWVHIKNHFLFNFLDIFM